MQKNTELKNTRQIFIIDMMINQYLKIIEGKICPYCNSETELIDTVIIYGRSYGNAWACKNYPKCDAFVGVHKHNNKPLGRLANEVLRTEKKNAHSVFDALWKEKARRLEKDGMKHGDAKGRARRAAYRWLSRQMDIEKKYCHIGMFDVEQCKRVVEICRPHYQKLI